MKKLLTSSILACLFMMPAAFSSNHNDGCSDKQAQSELKNTLKQLDLSFAQKREMRKIKMDAQNQQQEIATQLEQNMMKLQEYSAGNYDAKAISKLAEKQGELIAKRIEQNMKLRNDMFNVLDDEQKMQFKQIIGR